jgi:L-ascorbate metabolism protein UlaG (beta-lactamase superfamily)
MTPALTYLGHCAFIWRTELGRTLLIDPYGDPVDGRWFLRAFPPLESDVVAVTHDHFDHNELDAFPGQPTVLRGPGEFRLDDLCVTGVMDLHSGRSGCRGLVNTIFIVETAGVRFCHIGDNRHDLPDEVRQDIGGVDVLMVTVDDSSHLLTNEQVDVLVQSLSPRVVVPMHYYIPDLTAVESTLETPDGWLATQGSVRRLQAPEIEISPEGLPDSREVWIFDAKLGE